MIVDDTGEIKACTVDYNNERHVRTVVLIPEKKKVDGKKLLELIAHEIGIHAMTNKRHDELFGGLGMGSDWEMVREGFAKLNEENAMKGIVGDSYRGIDPAPYYVLAMAKARKSIDARGQADILEIYYHIVDLKKKDLSIDQEKLSRYAYDKGFSDLEAALAHKADKETKVVLRRVFRGIYPYYFPKDKAYLEREEIVRGMRDARRDGYEYESKTDPKLLPGLIRLGFL